MLSPHMLYALAILSFVVIILVLYVEGYELWGPTFSNLIYLLP